MTKKKELVAYIGRENNVHDKLFVEALEKKYSVIQKYTNNIPDLFLDEKFFDNCRLIIAGPLTDAISVIPESVSIPILGISHGFDLNIESNNVNLQNNIDRCSSVIADCKYVSAILQNNYQYAKNIYNMPYGCDYEYFSNSIPVYRNEPRILVTRNWFQVHSNPVIVAALEILLRIEVRFECTFIGDGPILTNTIREISKRSRTSTVNFLGTISKEDIRNEMFGKWLYISAAVSDGTSISLLEAMSAGMICIASDFPSNLEWIQHGYNGYVFERNNAVSLSALIQEVCSVSIADKKIIGDRARLTARTRGNWLVNQETLMSASQTIMSMVSDS